MGVIQIKFIHTFIQIHKSQNIGESSKRYFQYSQASEKKGQYSINIIYTLCLHSRQLDFLRPDQTKCLSTGLRPDKKMSGLNFLCVDTMYIIIIKHI